MELLAALAGTYYLIKNTSIKNSEKYLVYFLWFTFIIEMIGMYAPVAYFSKYQYFSFVEDNNFRNSDWLFNCYSIVSYLFYIYYFRSQIMNIKRRNILKLSLIFFLISSILYLFYFDVIFYEVSKYTAIVGTLLLFLSVIFYYLELLKSDTILKVKRLLPFYISVGALIFHLCMTPIDIFSVYFQEGNELFITLQVNIKLYANLFMYSMYVLGFILCQKKMSY